MNALQIAMLALLVCLLAIAIPVTKYFLVTKYENLEGFLLYLAWLAVVSVGWVLLVLCTDLCKR